MFQASKKWYFPWENVWVHAMAIKRFAEMGLSRGQDRYKDR